MIAEDTDPLDKAICSERLAHIHTLLDDLGAGCKEIFLAYVEGMPVAQIVEKYGYNPATINKAVTRIQMYLETRGGSARYELPYRPKPFTKELSDEVRLLWQGGATFVDLAEKYNTTPTTIRTICLRLRKMDKE
jgi:DNA-binding CsgD family transcriptional regulator